MGNCLVTKLKESVNNPDLLKIGENLLASSGEFSMQLYSPETWSVRNMGNTVVNVGETSLNPGEEITETAQEKMVTCPAGSKIAIGKNQLQNIKELTAIDGSLKDKYGFIPNLKILQLYSNGDLSFCSSLVLEALYLYNNNISSVYIGLTGSKSSLLVFTSYGTFDTPLTTAQIGEFVSLGEVVLPDGKLTGTVEEFVQVQRASGRTTGTVSFRYPSATLTYRDAPLTIGAYGWADVSWDSAGNITVTGR